jgi:hypothetical protein
MPALPRSFSQLAWQLSSQLGQFRLHALLHDPVLSQAHTELHSLHLQVPLHCLSASHALSQLQVLPPSHLGHE